MNKQFLNWLFFFFPPQARIISTSARPGSPCRWAFHLGEPPSFPFSSKVIATVLSHQKSLEVSFQNPDFCMEHSLLPIQPLDYPSFPWTDPPPLKKKKKKSQAKVIGACSKKCLSWYICSLRWGWWATFYNIGPISDLFSAVSPAPEPGSVKYFCCEWNSGPEIVGSGIHILGLGPHFVIYWSCVIVCLLASYGIFLSLGSLSVKWGS